MSEGLGEITVYGLAIDPRNSEVVYAGTDGSGVYRSADGGESWQVMSEGLGNLVVETLAIDSTLCPTLYAATKDGVWWYRPPKP
jgi:photosystem II stability/assembly factor-like uncharacterized protein